MKNKPGKSYAWLPSQVQYGMDVSDPDPAKWQPFGEYHDRQLADKAAAAKNGKQRSDPPEQ